MKLTDIFNDKSINIFVDASVLHKESSGIKETIGCPGMCIVICDEFGNEQYIEDSSYIVRNSTNNDSEIKAIQYGLDSGMKFMSKNQLIFENINIFSDSQICIKGLTEWVYSWFNNTRNEIMYNSSGEPVSNQDTFKAIFFMILNNQVHINFYHQKGHVTNTSKSLYKALDCFKKSNKLRYVEMDLIERISYYNNYVDLFTKQMLDRYDKAGSFNLLNISTIQPISFNISGFDPKTYKKLTKRSLL